MVLLIPDKLELEGASKLPIIEVPAKEVSRSPSPQANHGLPVKSSEEKENAEGQEQHLEVTAEEIRKHDGAEKQEQEGECFEIREIPGKGIGMIAKRRIFPGELIMEEFPWIVISDAIYNDMEKTEKLLDKTVENMNADQITEFLSLTDCRNPEDPTYLGIFYTNDMNFDGDCALFPKMARVNHACRANSEFTSRRDAGLQRLVSNYTIEEGEEVTINYMPMVEEGSDIRDVRRAYLRQWYSFQCACAICTKEDFDVDADDKIREEIKELQSVGLENLSIAELELLIEKVHLIHGKLSYVADLLEVIYRKTVDSADQYMVGARLVNLAVALFGDDSKEAETWRERISFNESTRLVLWNSVRQSG